MPNWPKWDTGLKSAELKREFAEGAKGRLVPDKGPKSKFIITDVKQGMGYTLKTKIPFGWMNVKRRLEATNSGTYFTHEVEFTGLLKKMFGKKYGSRYQKLLPDVMQSISKIAEKKNNRFPKFSSK